ncbi:beta-ketoacyl-ACP reductase [Haloferacaceae archaeon DSL9]
MDVTDRTCVITGASRGIGRGIATKLADSGANVVVNYRSSEGAAIELVEQIRSTGGTAVAVQADVTKPNEVRGLREQTYEAYGPVDILINNAGITNDTTFSKMTTEEWMQVVDVNLHGTFHCTKVFFDEIKASEHGRLINISSIVGKQGNFGQANYAAAKSGMFGFTRTLALELAPSGSTANCIAPGFTRTEMLADVPQGVQDRICGEIPLGRFASVEDITGLVWFLASDLSAYITGEVIDVNGGMDL